MKVEIGKSYRVVENRESFYGGCSDIVELEGKVVTVVSNAASKGYNIKDRLGNGHVCEEFNLEEIKVTELVLRDKEYEYGTVGEESPFKDSDGAKLYVGDTIEKFYNGSSYDKDFVVKTNDYGFFVMGIQGDCNNSTGKIKDWSVKLVEKHDSLKPGDKCGCITVTEGEEIKKSEQLKDNIKEDGIVAKDFKNGDKVRFIEELSTPRVSIGDTAIVEDAAISTTGKIKVRMDKDNDWWHVLPSKLELRVDNSKFEIITSGTTTTVRLEDGREGVAKLYYKDVYNKGFGIVAALGKAMDIDLIGEVQKVISEYKVEGTKPKLTIIDEAASAHVFKVGDLVRGLASEREFGITNKKMTKAEVTKVAGEGILVKVLEHEDKRHIGYESSGEIRTEYFELIEAPSVKFEVGCKVKIPKTKLGKYGIGSAAINIAKKESKTTYS